MFPAVPASAADVAANCAGLQAALTQAVAGNTITLTESCNNQSFDLPTNPSGSTTSPITLQGLTGNEVLTGGTGGITRILTGTNVHRFIISQLTFRNGFASAANGGAISVTGDSALTLDQDTFLGNHADGTGGAVYTTDTNATDQAGPVVRFSHFGDANDPDNPRTQTTPA
jgi:predicted outer membrane repeat protein